MGISGGVGFDCSGPVCTPRAREPRQVGHVDAS